MKKNIAFLVGGFSGEFEVSLNSARFIESRLVSDKYRFFKIVVTQQDWYYQTPEGDRFSIDKNDFSLLLPDGRVRFDAAFILIHGTPGEDGLIQAYLDMLRIPYPSCGHICSTVTFNKNLTNTIARTHGVPVARAHLVRKGQPTDPDEILARLTLPVFVKPNRGGSSLGTFKVSTAVGLEPRIREAFAIADEVLIEEYIPGRELTIGLVRLHGHLITMPITEVIAPNEFFDFEAKYTPGACLEITPARITPEMKSRIETSAAKLYDLFDCRGIVRLDYIWHETEDVPYLLEINTIPGMTATSFIPQQLDAMDLPVEELIFSLLGEIC